MKFLGVYFKGNGKWLAFGLGNCALTALLLALYHVRWSDIGYVETVLLFVLAVMFGKDFLRMRQKYRHLEIIKENISVSLEDLPEADDRIEQEYQEMLTALLAEKVKQENEAQGRQKDLREYFAMWVHQIKTPIFALRLLMQEKDGTVGMTEELDELFRIEQYVEMALQYMRLDADTTDFVFGKVDLDAVVRGAVHKYARMFIHKKIQLDYEPLKTVVLTDEKWLGFVVEQLLSNVVKYTAKGKVTISAEIVENDTQGKTCFLVIADTGIGICAEDLPRVCEKGYTGYNGHADKHSTGIGLYLCSRILKKLGHTFMIDSKEGIGTTVRIGFLQEKQGI